MEKCPNCGYKLYSLWPMLLVQAAFIALYFLRRFDPVRKHDWIADVAVLMSLIGSVAFGIIRKGRAYELKSGVGKPGSTI